MKHKIINIYKCPNCKHTLKINAKSKQRKKCIVCSEHLKFIKFTQTIEVTAKEWKEEIPSYINTHPLSYNFDDLKFLARRQYDISDGYDLKLSLSRFIIPRLEHWIKSQPSSHPCNIPPKTWLSHLEKMLKSFQYIAKNDLNLNHQVEIEDGLDLFRLHFNHLWD